MVQVFIDSEYNPEDSGPADNSVVQKYKHDIIVLSHNVWYSLHRYFHMTPQRFDDLLRRIEPAMARKTARMRLPVPPGWLLPYVT